MGWCGGEELDPCFRRIVSFAVDDLVCCYFARHGHCTDLDEESVMKNGKSFVCLPLELLMLLMTMMLMLMMMRMTVEICRM